MWSSTASSPAVSLLFNVVASAPASIFHWMLTVQGQVSCSPLDLQLLEAFLVHEIMLLAKPRRDVIFYFFSVCNRHFDFSYLSGFSLEKWNANQYTFSGLMSTFASAVEKNHFRCLPLESHGS